MTDWPKSSSRASKEAKSLIVLLHHGGKQCFSFQSLIVMLTCSWWQSHSGVPPIFNDSAPKWLLHVSFQLLLVGLSGQWLSPGRGQSPPAHLLTAVFSVTGADLPFQQRCAAFCPQGLCLLQEQEHHKLISSPLWPILNIACYYKYFTMPQGEEMDISYFMAGELVPVNKMKICFWCGSPLSSLRAFFWNYNSSIGFIFVFLNYCCKWRNCSPEYSEFWVNLPQMCQNKQPESVPNIIIDHLFLKNFGRKGLILFCKVVFNCLSGHGFLFMHSVTHACFGTCNKQSKDIIICLTSFTYFYGTFHPVCCKKTTCVCVYIYTQRHIYLWYLYFKKVQYLCLGLPGVTCRILHSALLNSMKFTQAHLSSLSGSLWMASLPPRASTTWCLWELALTYTIPLVFRPVWEQQQVVIFCKAALA